VATVGLFQQVLAVTVENGCMLVHQPSTACKSLRLRGLNRPGIPGDFNLREDRVYGNNEAVFGRGTGACCPAGA
jgi:hypothetical protein